MEAGGLMSYQPSARYNLSSNFPGEFDGSTAHFKGTSGRICCQSRMAWPLLLSLPVKTFIAFGLLSFIWVSVVTFSWLVGVVLNTQLTVPVAISLIGVGLIVLSVAVRKAGWCRTQRDVQIEKAHPLQTRACS